MTRHPSWSLRRLGFVWDFRRRAVAPLLAAALAGCASGPGRQDFFDRGNYYLLAADYPQALQQFTAILDNFNRNDWEVRARMAQVYQEWGSTLLAGEATQAQANQRHDTAHMICQSLLVERPNALEPKAVLGHLYFSRAMFGNYIPPKERHEYWGQAIPWFEPCLAANPDSPSLLYNLALCHFARSAKTPELDDFARSRELFKKLEEKHPKFFEQISANEIVEYIDQQLAAEAAGASPGGRNPDEHMPPAPPPPAPK